MPDGGPLRLLVTEESGRLARWLRLMGYDAVLSQATPLSALYRRAYNERRAVITRNRRVGASCLFRVVHLDSERLDGQLRQLMRELRLTIDEQRAFSRCDVCNTDLETAEKASVQERVPPYVFQTQTKFYRCPSCQRIYWAATHWQRACRFFERVRQEASHA